MEPLKARTTDGFDIKVYASLLALWHTLRNRYQMDIVQTVTLAVGLNVVKHLIRLWLDNNLRSEDISTSLDTLKQRLDIQLDQAANLQRGESTQDSFRVRLRQGLVDRFSGDELRTLCFDMSVDYESFPDQGKTGLAREIVAHCERTDSIPRLIARCRQLRPNGPWDVMPEPLHQTNIEKISADIVEGMRDPIENASRNLDSKSREAVVLAIIQTIPSLEMPPSLLVAARLDPARLLDILQAHRAQEHRNLSADEAALYDKILQELSQNLVYLATNLSGYQLARDQRILQDLDALLQNLDSILSSRKQEVEGFESTYCKALRNQLNRFEQIGLDYANEATKYQDLSRAYVPIPVEELDTESPVLSGQPEPPPNASGTEKRAQNSSSSLNDALLLSRRIVVQGPPGAGKSTLLRWIGIRACQKDFSQHFSNLASWDDCVPFFIQLRTTIGKSLPNPQAWVKLNNPMLAQEPPPAWVSNLLQNGRALVLLDGIDELPHRERQIMLDNLKELVSTYPFARYVITSRPAALKNWHDWQNWTRQESFVSVSLQDMHLEQILVFVDRWHEALTKTSMDPEEPKKSKALSERLKLLLQQRLSLRKLASSPLLCAIICALHRRNPNSLPDDRVKLYSECIDLLLYKRDQERLILNSSNDYPALSITHIVALLQEYADHLMSNNLSEESSTDVEDFFDRHLPLMNLTNWTGRSLRDYFVARTGLLIEPVDGVTAFRHRTFQEFLSAKVTIRKNNIRMLLGKARYDEWRETIILAMGLPETDKKQCDLFIGGLLRKSKALKTKQLKNELLFLAVACLETATWLSTDIRKEVIEEASNQMPPRNSDECRLIARAGEVVIDMLRYNPAHSYREMAYCIEAVTSVGSELAMSAIGEYIDSEHYSRTDNSVFILHRAVGKSWLRFSGLRRARDIFGDIETLDLSSAYIGDTYLDRISELPNLRVLDISNSPISDIRVLANLKNLHSLDLMNTNITNQGLQQLASQTQLHTLDLRHTLITDDGIPSIERLKGLQRLYLSSTKLTDFGLKFLSELSELKVLDLSRTAISDRGLHALSNLKRLVTLDLRSTNITDEGLQELVSLESLQTLYVMGTQITRDGRKYLTSCLPRLSVF